MIKVNGFVIKPTIFPDGTSQIWKLPEGLLDNKYVTITWYFEAEREIIDLFGIRALFPSAKEIALHMPYMPYARQDKEVDNNSTFSLSVFASIINSLHFSLVSTVDVHNPVKTKELIKNFESYDVTTVQQILIGVVNPDCIVYPDKGANDRYNAKLKSKLPTLVFPKDRDQSTGQITRDNMPPDVRETLEDLGVLRSTLKREPRFLIIDDICDGGATFIGLANVIHGIWSKADVHLFVTHGLFSKGMKPLADAGITAYTTNSLLKNVEGFNV